MRKSTLALFMLIQTLSTASFAEQITPKSPSDFCMSGVCIFDDISKYPALKKKFTNDLKQLNDKSYCKGQYISNVGLFVNKNGNKIYVSFTPYVTNGNVSLRTDLISYRTDNSNGDYLDSLLKDYISKYNIEYQGSMDSNWKDDIQSVRFRTNNMIGGSLTAQWIPSNDLASSLNEEIIATKPACNAKPYL
ncbi:MAG: hypothetical protein ACXW11_03480 [Methylotenera sp.]